MISVGSPFPQFSLLDHNGNLVSKESLLGKEAIFFFYPKADTPG